MVDQKTHSIVSFQSLFRGSDVGSRNYFDKSFGLVDVSKQTNFALIASPIYLKMICTLEYFFFK